MPNHADNAADSTQVVQAGAAPIDQRRGTRRDTSSTRQTTEVEFRQWTPAGGRRISRLTLRPMPSSPLRFFVPGCLTPASPLRTEQWEPQSSGWRQEDAARFLERIYVIARIFRGAKSADLLGMDQGARRWERNS